MTTETPSRPISPLRARMIEDMRVRGVLELLIDALNRESRRPSAGDPWRR